MGIQSQSYLIRANGTAGIRLFQVVLPIAAEKVPVARVIRLELRSPLIPLRRIQPRIVHRKGIANGGVRESGGAHERKKDKKPAPRRTGKAKNHPAIHCIDKLSDAS